MDLTSISKRGTVKTILGIVAVVLLSIPAWGALVHPGFFPTHDANWFIIRFTEFHRMLRDGQFPVRFGTNINFGYGYPVFTFVYPLPLILLEVIHLIGFGFVDAYKVLLALSFPLSGIGMFLWIRSRTRSWWAGVSAAALYMFAPYRFVDVYVRGSFGEVTAFIFPPFVLWGVERWIQDQRRFSLLIAGVATAGVMLSHNIMAVLFGAWILGYVIVRLWRKTRATVFPLVVSLALGGGMSMFFWIPALVEQRFVQFGQIFVSSFFAHFLTLEQLFFSSWGYGASVVGAGDGMTFQLGPVHVAFLLGAFGMIILKKTRRSMLLYGFITTFIIIVLMLEASSFLWKIADVHRFFQHPWRLLAVSVLSLSMLGGLVIGVVRYRVLVSISVIVLVVSLAWPMVKPQYYEDKGDGWYATNDSPTTIADEYMPRWVRAPLPPRANQRVEIEQGDVQIEISSEKSNEVIVRADSDGSSVIRMNTIDYPGWRAWIDGQRSNISRDPQWGFILVGIPDGAHVVRVAFGETWWRFLADGLSAVSVLGLGFYTLRRRGS